VPGQPERLVALKRREVTELISEELRRMDPDEVYESTVKSLVGPPESKRPTTTKRTSTKRTTTKRAAKKPAAKRAGKKSAAGRSRG
jgi:glucose-6-phosphate dehydrogenase assembly protein OpcA